MLHRLVLLVPLLLGASVLGAGRLRAQPAGCAGLFAGGAPPALLNPKMSRRTTPLCYNAYAALASGVTKGPLWSAERLTTDGLDGARGLPREGEFHPDIRLPAGDRAWLEDYRESGFDRGHMSPSGDMPDAEAQQQSFSLANVVPQAGPLNRGVWSAIETAVRELAVRRGELFVVTGPAYVGAEVKAIGPDQVLVPSATWKAIYDPRTRASGVYVCSNLEAPRCAVVSVADLAAMVGIDPFPAVPVAAKRTAMRLPEPDEGGRRRRNYRPPPGLLGQFFGR